MDPYRLDNMDTFSNLLYVKVRFDFAIIISIIISINIIIINIKCGRAFSGRRWWCWSAGFFIGSVSPWYDFEFLKFFQEMKAELAYLAHHCCEIDKYRVETCCILGELALHIKIDLFLMGHCSDVWKSMLINQSCICKNNTEPLKKWTVCVN